MSISINIIIKISLTKWFLNYFELWFIYGVDFLWQEYIILRVETIGAWCQRLARTVWDRVDWVRIPVPRQS